MDKYRIEIHQLREHLRRIADFHADEARLAKMMRQMAEQQADDMSVILIAMNSGLPGHGVATYHDATSNGISQIQADNQAIGREFEDEADGSMEWSQIFDDLGANLDVLSNYGVTRIELDQNPETLTHAQLAVCLSPVIEECLQELADRRGPDNDHLQLGG